MSLEPLFAKLLAPRGGYPGVGPERGPRRPPANGIARYVDPFGSTRYVRYVGGAPVAGLQVMSRDGRQATIANVYTAPGERRRGHASVLLARARRDFASVVHAGPDALSVEGAHFARARPNGDGKRPAVQLGLLTGAPVEARWVLGGDGRWTCTRCGRSVDSEHKPTRPCTCDTTARQTRLFNPRRPAMARHRSRRRPRHARSSARRRTRPNAKADWSKVDGKWVKHAGTEREEVRQTAGPAKHGRAAGGRDKAREKAAEEFPDGWAARSGYFASWNVRDPGDYPDEDWARALWERDSEKYHHHYAWAASQQAHKGVKREARAEADAFAGMKQGHGTWWAKQDRGRLRRNRGFEPYPPPADPLEGDDPYHVALRLARMYRSLGDSRTADDYERQARRLGGGSTLRNPRAPRRQRPDLGDAQAIVGRLRVDPRWRVARGHSPYPPPGYDHSGPNGPVAVSLSFAAGSSGYGAGTGTSYVPIRGAAAEAARIARALTAAGFRHVGVSDRFHGFAVVAWPDAPRPAARPNGSRRRPRRARR